MVDIVVSTTPLQWETESSQNGDTMKTGIIYKLTCLINDNMYIGKTMRTINERFTEHKNNRRSQYLYNAIAKYGKEAFQVEILELCSEDILDDRERHWIAALNSMKPNGYNLTYGGQACSPSMETRQKLSKVRKGRVPWNKGKIGIYSDESRKRMGKTKEGKKRKRPDKSIRNLQAKRDKYGRFIKGEY